MHQLLPGSTAGTWQYCLQANGRRLAKADFNESQHLARLLFADGSEQVIDLPIREPVVAKINSKKDIITLRWADSDDVAGSGHFAFVAQDTNDIPSDARINCHSESGKEAKERIPLEDITQMVTPSEATNASIPPLEENIQTILPSEAINASIPPLEENRQTIPPSEATNASVPPLEENRQTIPPSEAIDASVPPLEDNRQTIPPSEAINASVPPLEEIAQTIPPSEAINASVPPLEDILWKPPPVDPSPEVPNVEAFTIPDDCANPAAEELFLRMEAVRQKKKGAAKKKEAAAAAKVNESSFGLKKGFLAGASKPSKPKDGVIEVAPKVSKTQPLQLKEVQEAMEGVTRDTSWVTPDLMKAVQMKPNILKGMANPRIQQALELMGKDPEGAKVAYKDDPEVLSFLKEFASLMSTHFDVIGKDSSALPAAQNEPVATVPVDKELAQLMLDPEIQELVQTLRTQPIDINSFLARKPHLMPKVKMLIDRKLFNVASM